MDSVVSPQSTYPSAAIKRVALLSKIISTSGV